MPAEFARFSLQNRPNLQRVGNMRVGNIHHVIRTQGNTGSFPPNHFENSDLPQRCVAITLGQVGTVPTTFESIERETDEDEAVGSINHAARVWLRSGTKQLDHFVIDSRDGYATNLRKDGEFRRHGHDMTGGLRPQN
ncbi:MAG: hypothetical protein AAF497_16480 [Planctomycetota bacterium]